MTKRVRRTLLAYAVQYDDGSLEFAHVLECSRFNLSFDPDLQYRNWHGDRYAYYGFNQTYTVEAMGHKLHEWPAGWQRRPTDDAEPVSLPPGCAASPPALPAPQEDTP